MGVGDAPFPESVGFGGADGGPPLAGGTGEAPGGAPFPESVGVEFAGGGLPLGSVGAPGAALPSVGVGPAGGAELPSVGFGDAGEGLLPPGGDVGEALLDEHVHELPDPLPPASLGLGLGGGVWPGGGVEPREGEVSGPALAFGGLGLPQGGLFSPPPPCRA